MKPPDERALMDDIDDAPFKIGASKGHWNLVEPVAPEDVPWPWRIFWIAPAARTNAPDRFFLRLDCKDYPVVSPTGAFWDLEKKEWLAAASWPKGTGRIAAVFRPDWKGGTAFYHPYDRVSASDHGRWLKEHPHLIWTDKCTIVDYLSAIHGLLNCADYTGI